MNRQIHCDELRVGDRITGVGRVAKVTRWGDVVSITIVDHRGLFLPVMVLDADHPVWLEQAGVAS